MKNFEEKWFVLHNTLDVPFTNKVHVIIQHVPEVCERTGQSLHNNSEQVVEASHQKFNVVWENYKVLDLERPTHGENLLKCVLEFNTMNI